MNKKHINVLMIEFSEYKFDARVLRLATSLGKIGYNVTLIMFSEYNTFICREKKKYFYSIVYPFINKKQNSNIYQKLGRLFSATLLILKMWWNIISIRSDIIHAHNLYFLIPAYFHKKIYKSKMIYDAHELHSKHHDDTTKIGKFINLMIHHYEKYFMKRVDSSIQASNERAEYIEKIYQIKKPEVINNYVEYRLIRKNNYFHEIFRLNENQKILLYIGGIYGSGSRRIDKILEAISLIESQELIFVIIGFMNQLSKLKILSNIQTLNLEKQVKILPPVNAEDVVKFASYADIGIIPLAGNSLNTKYSALNKISEYMMAGLPIVCSDYPNLKKIIYNNNVGQIGVTFNVEEPYSIKNAIEITLNNIQKFSSNSLRLGHEEFNWENEEIKLKKIYSNILNKNKSGCCK